MRWTRLRETWVEVSEVDKVVGFWVEVSEVGKVAGNLVGGQVM